MSVAHSGSALARQLSAPRFIRWLLLFVLCGAAIYLGCMVWSGWAQVAEAFGRLGASVLLAAAGIACLTYLVRFSRWHLILRWMGSRIPVPPNLGIYLSGLALTASPGKLGETIRTVLLSPLGVPAARSLGAFLTDRLSDVAGVCLLGVLAGLAGGAPVDYTAFVLVAVLTGSFVFRRIVRQPAALTGWTAFLARWGRLPGRLVSQAVVEWSHIWSVRNATLFAAAATVAYGIQAGVFAWLCHLLGLDLPLALAVKIFVNATLLGAASMVPGGLGAMEAALVVQLLDQGAGNAVAVTAAIATRLVTLWCGILIGAGSLLAVASRMDIPSE